MKNNILIIGSLGMLGQELLKIFSDAVAWDREEIDITDKNQVEDKIEKLNPEIIINCAAYNAVDKCETSDGFKLAKKINGEAVGYLADACLKNNAILIHFSTNYVFNGENQNGYNEYSEPNPISKYGQTKLIGEQELLKRPELKYYLIRTSKLFGEKGSSEVAKDSFFDIMIKLAKTEAEIRVIDDELSNFTYTPDLAEATKDLLKQNYPVGIYHLVNENPCTWFEGTQTLFDILKKDVKLIQVNSDEFPRPAKRPKQAILNNNKFPKLRRYEDALAEYLYK